jgi:hypothetical protein
MLKKEKHRPNFLLIINNNKFIYQFLIHLLIFADLEPIAD